jgi:ABC-type glutathione transport system ATPase component
MESEQLEVVFNLFTKADDKALQLINANIEIFEALRKADLDKKGTKWEDLILRFEWLSNWTNI